MSEALRIAMWSGPRNISTALMRSWGSRSDTVVCDEPFYAHYLRHVAVDHPGRDEVLASQENDWHKVADWLTGPIPEGRPIWYQKHMAQHFLTPLQNAVDMSGPWFGRLTHCFLIRDPKAVIASFSKVVHDVGPRDTGFPQLLDLYQRAADLTGTAPPVVDSAAILAQPEATLTRLCAALGIAFDPAMLSWAPGPRSSDGVWAKYWYHAVEASTGFQPAEEREIELPAHLQRVYEQCLPMYEVLRGEVL